jgi:translation initiation factor IF-2
MQLLNEGLELEEFGGDVQCVQTAAKAGLGLKELEEALLLQVGAG